jgi:predicted nucleic acid-binding protein
MTATIFVDTNVLLYARDSSEPKKQPIAARWLEALWEQHRGRLSYWDAQIVAAARAGGCRNLLTEDLQHGQDLDGLLVMDPFEVPPEAVGHQ